MLMKKICIISILIFALFQSISYAQIGIQRKAFSPTLSSVVEYQSWEKSIGGETQTVSQLSFPTTFKMPLTRNVAFDLISSAIFSSSEDKGLSGLRDVKARGVATLADDTLLLSAGINLPSGRSELKSDEILVSSSLSDKSLGFRYSRLGEGLDINLGCGAARAFGTVAFGAGVGYVLKGEYGYLEDEDSKYKPGNQLNVTGGFDLSFKPLFLRSDLTYTMYSSDEVDGSEVFKEGTRLTVEETAILSMESFSVLLSGRYVMRGKSEILYTDFPGKSEKMYGDRININGMLNLWITKQLNLKLLGESAFIGEDERGRNDATVFGFGAGAALKFMRRSFLDVAGKYHIGNSDGDSVDLKGISTTATLKLVF